MAPCTDEAAATTGHRTGHRRPQAGRHRGPDLNARADNSTPCASTPSHSELHDNSIIAAISTGLIVLAVVSLVIGDRLVGLRRMADF